MSRLPIRELIVHKKEPLLTLELKESSIGHPQETVETYIYTDTIREYFSQILETVAQGKGQGFWVEDEYGSGKTHFLATLTALLSDFSDDLWNRVTDPEIRRYQTRLKDRRLFPVILSLRGEASNDALSEVTFFDVLLEKGFREALNRFGLVDKVKLTSAQDIMSWFTNLDKDHIDPIKNYIKRKSGISLEEYLENGDEETAAQWIQTYMAESNTQPVINRSIKDRLASIYRQISHLGYEGLLVIVDEYEGWSNSHLNNLQARAHDEDLLETLGYLLWKELNFSVHTIVASQSSMSIKLRGGQEGDRYINLPLLASRK